MKYVYSIINILIIAFYCNVMSAENLVCTKNMGFTVDEFPVTNGSYQAYA